MAFGTVKPEGTITSKAPIKAGQKSVKDKKSINLDEWSPTGGTMDIPKGLKKLATDEGIEYRWLDNQKLAQNQNIHPRGWRVFRLKDKALLGIDDFHEGVGEDGLVRRGTMVLGYKPVEAADAHRDWLKDKRRVQSNSQSNAADKLRSMAKGKARVVEGYEENE